MMILFPFGGGGGGGGGWWLGSITVHACHARHDRVFDVSCYVACRVSFRIVMKELGQNKVEY